jgi:3-phenylpropionate/trans-cinnamate dioxygenase ferredoxin reductase subunit
MLHVKYLLIGAGGAGSAAAEAIRANDPAGSILLIGQEHNRPYLRPELSKTYLRRERSRAEIAALPVGWYTEHGVELRTGRRAVSLDTARACITLDSGEEAAFDQLLIATGSSPRPLKIPGAELPNVYYLHTLDDCDRILHALDKAKSEGRTQPGHPKIAASPRGCVAVIGAGLLAVELAASLKQMNFHVELVVGRSHPWARYAGETIGRFITTLLQDHGVVVHNDLTAEQLEGDGRVQHVRMSNGKSIDCDLALAAIGVVPHRELLRGTPIAAEKAILVDARCRTNLPNIYAAGDCAAILDPLYGKHRVLDHWNTARLTGAIAGASMAGPDARYDIVSTFSSDVFDLKLTAWGDPRFVDRRLVRSSLNGASPQLAEIGVASDGRVVQIVAIGRTEEHGHFHRLIQSRFNVAGKEEIIKDPLMSLDQLG